MDRPHPYRVQHHHRMRGSFNGGRGRRCNRSMEPEGRRMSDELVEAVARAMAERNRDLEDGVLQWQAWMQNNKSK